MPVTYLGQDTVARLPFAKDLTKSDGSQRRQVLYWDDASRRGGLRGFGLLCSINGKGETTRSFVAQRSGGQRHTLGRFPDVSVKKARQEARAKLGEKAGRLDGAPVTLREAMEDYLTGMVHRKLSPRSMADLEGNITRCLSDWLDKPLRDISASDVRQCHATIGKRNGPYKSNSVFRNFRAVFNDAQATHRELQDRPNPCVSLRRRWFKENQREETVEDLADWYAKVMALPNPIRRAFHLFVLYTGLRSEDARTVRWRDVDWEAGTLHRPTPKGGVDRAFTIPLSRRALALLRYARMAGRKLSAKSPWVFPTRATNGRITHMKEAKQQKQVKGKKVRHLPGPHVLRHTFVTFGMSLGVPEYEIGILVNHRLPKGSMTQRYVGRHAMLTDRLREVQEAVSTALTEAMGRAKK
jgi:integrase